MYVYVYVILNLNPNGPKHGNWHTAGLIHYKPATLVCSARPMLTLIRNPPMHVYEVLYIVLILAIIHLDPLDNFAAKIIKLLLFSLKS